MKAVKYHLTPEQEVEFDEAMSHWQGELSLEDWRIERGRRDPVPYMAQVKISYGARMAVYRTGNWGAEKATTASIYATALHEVLHILLAEFKRTVEQGGDIEAIESAEHRIVTTIEKKLIGLVS